IALAVAARAANLEDALPKRLSFCGSDPLDCEQVSGSGGARLHDGAQCSITEDAEGWTSELPGFSEPPSAQLLFECHFLRRKANRVRLLACRKASPFWLDGLLSSYPIR